MNNNFIFSVAALLTLLPVFLIRLRPSSVRDVPYFLALLISVTGPVILVVYRLTDSWRTDLATTLWVIIATGMVLFFLSAVITKESWRLSPLAGGYMILLGLLSLAWDHDPSLKEASSSLSLSHAWTIVHILSSLITYGLITLSALSAFSALLQKRGLKEKHPASWSRKLPSIVDSDKLMTYFLLWGEAILIASILSGAAVQWQETGHYLVVNHKTILMLVTFFLVLALLIMRMRNSVRSKSVIRIVLVSFLFMTLGFPGVKFVTEILFN